MRINIKVENNLLEILKYLESLGFKWCIGATPTGVVTDFIKKNCSYIRIANDGITWSYERPPKPSFSLNEFKRKYLNGILLEPGMSIEDNSGKIAIVIPHKTSYIAFVSYSDKSCWSLNLKSVLRGDIKTICDIPSDFSIDGDVLWEAKEVILNNQPSSKEEIIEKIRNYSGNIKVTLE